MPHINLSIFTFNQKTREYFKNKIPTLLSFTSLNKDFLTFSFFISVFNYPFRTHTYHFQVLR